MNSAASSRAVRSAGLFPSPFAGRTGDTAHLVMQRVNSVRLFLAHP